MAKIRLSGARLSGLATCVGNNRLAIEDEASKFQMDTRTVDRLKKTVGMATRHIVDPGVCTSDLCYQSAKTLLSGMELSGSDIDALIFVSQSPDYRAPSTAIILQDRLGLHSGCAAFDINLGCSGFVYGLYTAMSFVQSGMRRVLLLVGDVASSFVNSSDKIMAPLMGDAGSAALIERADASESFFILGSDGSGFGNLIIPAGGCRNPISAQSLEVQPRADGGNRSDADMYMNGGEIFNFAIKTVPPLLLELLDFAKQSKEGIDYFVLHQANRYILQNIAQRLAVDSVRLPMGTAPVYGNQNSASIPGTINGFLSTEFSSRRLRNVFAGFGIGLSWAACIVETDKVFCPDILYFCKDQETRSGDRSEAK